MLTKEFLAQLSNNQRKLMSALSENVNGLLSSELASKTAVSNKSATITPELRELLAKHGLELNIEKHVSGTHEALWTLKQVNTHHGEYDKNMDFRLFADYCSGGAYPRIIQMIPAPNMWNMYRDDSEGYFYVKVGCLALLEIDNGDDSDLPDQILKYVDIDDAGCTDLDLKPFNFIKTVYCETNPND
jgi:hypothetical protein